MNETIRIRTTPNGSDTYLKTAISQDFDFIEILSLKISQEDVYRKFCSDYGVVVGRVVINQGFGIPNAKVSIFIPIDEIDINNPEIKGLYPYEVITDKNSDGIRYNLLSNNLDEADDCYTPVGSFPSKNEILDNPHMELVYDKYYKFTTTTNHAGDFMIFGVPLGSYTVHVDADISNIGIASQRPYDLITQGAPIAMFESSTKFKADKNLNKLPQIKTLNSGVNVQPFWGDVDSCEIGITRLDFDLNYNIIPSAIFLGSIFGDEGKHSVNKNCQPNKNVGQICEQVTTSGSINMIRKSFNGEIEEFDVNGGRVIDEDGTWAYQIPMNLDYMVTDENGTLVFSDDPNIGIPTRARVRFNIGMDENGGEGRLRTRARYLVPNNPTKTSEIDYEFGSETKDTSFRDLYWNKIYTVSNYISRFQANDKKSTRGTTGIKNIDNCVSVKTPFPYNKVDTNVNPIFFLICLIVQIIQIILIIINGIIAVINGIINVINSICRIKIAGSRPFKGLCLDYVKCLGIECNGILFVPGCSGHGNDDLPPNHETSGLDNCFLFLIAKFLTIFELDFYNDWVNGSLFSFLLKYKKRRHGEKFCDYECDTNESSNSCHTNFLVDSCVGGSEDNIKTIRIHEGLIKKIGDEFYYAATTHDTNHKMFATEIVNLGSVLECDWQGIPKINNALVSTSYIIPPDISEYDENGQLDACGMVSLNSSHDTAMFFTIDCLGTHVDRKGCLNMKHICEIGVNISESDYNENGEIVTTSNCIVGAEDIDDETGHLFRDVFTSLNYNLTPWIGINSFEDRPYTTSFNLKNEPVYNYTIADGVNGEDYVNFRGYSGSDSDYTETKNSYFFYFGLVPGKSALDKMNNKFFNKCKIIKKDVLTIVSTSTPDLDGLGSGTITFKFVGGKPNYSYNVIGFNYENIGTVDNSEVLLTNLPAGTYTINGVDSFNNPISKTINVSGPKPLNAFVYVSKNASSINSSDGQITISNISGGLAPYSYMVTKSNGAILVPNSIVNNIPLLIDGLPADELIGHTVTITDSIGNSIEITGLKISGAPLLSIVTTSVKNPQCFDSFDGEIKNSITGGQPPYTASTTGPDGYTSMSFNLYNLDIGTYVTTVNDSSSTSTPVSVTNTLVAISPEIILSLPSSSDVLRKQCNPLEHTITLYASFSFNAPSVVNIVYLNDNEDWVTLTSVSYVNQTTPIIFTYPNVNYELILAIKLDECYSNSVIITNSMVTKPAYQLTCNISQTGPVNGTYTYNVSGSGGIGSYQGTGIFTSASASYTATITDGVGCTATKTI